MLLTEVDGDIFELSVLNLSPRPMVVLRNQIVLRTPLGTRSRESGGLSSTYNIPSGGAHDVHVRYDMSDLAAGDVIQLRFEDALLIDGQPVPIGPIVLRVTGRERSR